MIQPVKWQRVTVLKQMFALIQKDSIFKILYGTGMQWFVSLWNNVKVSEADDVFNSGLDARTHRYEIAVGLIFGSQPGIEVAEIGVKVLDWADEEPLIAYIYILFLERVCRIYSREERVQQLLFEIYKRLLGLRQAPQACNLAFLLPLSQAYLLLSKYLKEPNLVKTLPTLILDQLKPLLTTQTCLLNAYPTATLISCFHKLKIGQQALYNCTEWLQQLQKKCFKTNDVRTCIDLLSHCKSPIPFPHSPEITHKHAMMLSVS